MDEKFKWYKQLCSEYLRKRNIHMRSKWLHPLSLVRRWFGSGSEFDSLREHDLQFNHETQKWFSASIRNGNACKESIKDFILYLGNHTVRVTDRALFLSYFAAFVVALYVLNKFGYLENSFLVALVLFSIFAILERSALQKRKSAYEEITNMLERELEYIESNEGKA